MKLTFLGTAAAEGFPAVFCNCDFCNRARELGGKNIRTRSQALINDDLLIDLPADTYLHFLQHGIRGDRVGTLLITHAHSDHLYPEELAMRGSCYAHRMERAVLDVVCSETVYEQIKPERYEPKIADGLRYHVVKPYESVDLGRYEVTALPARHAKEQIALFYMVREGNKTLLYAHDTGYFFEEVFGYIRENRLVFDGISLDCTNVNLPIKDTGSHMGFDNLARVIDRLRAMGAVGERTRLFVNHFSHNGNPIQEELEAFALPLGCSVAFDGMETEI